MSLAIFLLTFLCSLLVGSQVFKVEIPSLRTGLSLQPGHRFRIVITPQFMPHFSRSLQTGQRDAESSESVAADLEILHSASFLSSIILHEIVS